ncbi:uncharacterized protein hhla1 [Brachyhypopomus gauderio]|uniref:uncharacterized protein hhla1 n=1 Tax=Brachyhypopomus gauderio TaxID=698409 RepID=UPI0040426169
MVMGFPRPLELLQVKGNSTIGSRDRVLEAGCAFMRKEHEIDLELQDKRDILASTEIPIEYIDSSTIDLTLLVNTLINATHTGSQHLFSVLSVMSHSSLALHKLTLLVYNISNFQDIETTMFPTKYCYCVTNETNDLTDFTAVLLDVMGNSTSYLQELFKSTSILSVSQRNSSECIYICVMAGKTDRDLSPLWDSVPPLFNQTIIEETHRGSPALSATPPAMAVTMTTTPTAVATGTEHSSVTSTTDSSSGHTTIPTAVSLTAVPSTSATVQISVPMRTTSVTMTTSDNVSMTSLVTDTLGALPTVTTAISFPMTTEPITTPVKTVFSTATRLPAHIPVSTTPTSSDVRRTTDIAMKTSTTVPLTSQLTITTMTTSPALTKSPYIDKPGCPWRSELLHKESEGEGVEETLEEELGSYSPTVSAVKLQPCVFELCKFFSQCLCRGIGHQTALQRYCTDSHVWYEKHTVEVCSRVRRLTFSKSKCYKHKHVSTRTHTI